VEAHGAYQCTRNFFLKIKWFFHLEIHHTLHKKCAFDILIIFMLGLRQKLLEIKFRLFIRILNSFSNLKLPFKYKIEMCHWHALFLQYTPFHMVFFNKIVLKFHKGRSGQIVEKWNISDFVHFLGEHFFLVFFYDLETSAIQCGEVAFCNALYSSSSRFLTYQSEFAKNLTRPSFTHFLHDIFLFKYLWLRLIAMLRTTIKLFAI